MLHSKWNITQIICRVLLFLATTPVLSFSTCAQKPDNPLAWWKYDENRGNFIMESISGRRDTILNHYRWLDGVAGAALKFDGFTTAVDVGAADVPQIDSNITIAAWIAIQSYPWNWVSLVDQEQDHHAGYSFGIDAQGRLGLQLAVWGNWEVCLSQERLPLNQWLHVVAVYDSHSGASLYLNGKVIGKLPVTGRITPTTKTGLRIGRNFTDLPPTSLVRPRAAFAAKYSFDGIIDELKIYGRSFDSHEAQLAYQKYPMPKPPDLLPRRWPSLPTKSARFGAAYTNLRLYPEWDALWRTGDDADVVVSFAGTPFHYVFWRGANYGENLVTENSIWIGDQSFESHTQVGTAEHMNDKHNLYSHVSIVENTDARVVLHWRYALADVLGDISMPDPVTGWGNWADEFFYIYPDGVAERRGTVYGPAKHYSFTEPTLLLEPGKKPEDYISLDAATIANNDGLSKTYSWDPASPPFPFPEEPAAANIALLNTKSKFKAFYIYQPGTVLGPYGWPPELRPEYSHFPVWDHWPVNQIPSDGSYELFPDHYASAAVMSPDPRSAAVDGPGPSKTMYFLFGLTTKSAADLAFLDRSWLHPPRLNVIRGEYLAWYDASQKAYVLERNAKSPSPATTKLEFTLEGTPETPIVNPAFVIKNWGDRWPQIQLDGKAIPSSAMRIGLVPHLEETDLVIWLQQQGTKTIRLTFSESANSQ